MKKFFSKLGADLVINLTPAAYVLIGAFILTIVGFTILPMTIINVIGVILSIKIIVAEWTMKGFLYSSSKSRYISLVTNFLILLIGMTLLAI